jgi:hypothetical protein
MESMSFDLYLLPARTVHLDGELAGAFVDREDARFSQIPAKLDPECERKKAELADLLTHLNPNYREFQFDFQTIAEWEKISVQDARLKYRYIEMNSREKPADAQFLFFDHYVVGYSGTSKEEMDAILYSLSVIGDFVVYDPQVNRVVDLRK